MTIAEAIQVGLEHHRAGRLAEAEAIYRQILSQAPGHPRTTHMLGVLAHQAGHHDDAVELLRIAIEGEPAIEEYHDNLAAVLRSRGRHEEAAACYHRMVEMNPASAQAHASLGAAMGLLGALDEAVRCCRRAIELDANCGEGWHNLAITLQLQGLLPEAIECYRKMLALKPDAARLHSTYLLALHYEHGDDPQKMYAEHLDWARRYETPMVAQPSLHTNDRNPERRLRIGYVSPDFRSHAAFFFIEPILAGFDRERFDVVCYSNVLRPDSATSQLQQYPVEWREIRGMDHPSVCEMIRKDRIDILVDLAGHTADNRLMVFARKPAPVQVTYLGYPNTTGMRAMDYWITDEHLNPPGTDGPQCGPYGSTADHSFNGPQCGPYGSTADHSFNGPQCGPYGSEELIRLPGTFACYRPPPMAPPVEPTPALKNGFVTFGSFNRLTKLTDRVVELWSKVLLAVPNSRLMLKTAALADEPTRKLTMRRFEERGIPAGRLLIEREEAFDSYLAAYGRVDVALDPFPFTGHTTSLHGLWMGVPMVTLEGQTHVSRRGSMLLRNLKLEELIAKNDDEYVRVATKLAADPIKLNELRMGMRPRVKDSPLADAGGFMKNLEQAYRTIWKRWCEPWRK